MTYESSLLVDKEHVVCYCLQVIDRRIRELKVESVILPLNTPADELRQQGFM